MKVKMYKMIGMRDNSGILNQEKIEIINCQRFNNFVYTIKPSDNIWKNKNGKIIKNIFLFNYGQSGCDFYKPIGWFNKQKLLWLFKKHWLQKEENIRYITNLLYLSVGLIVGILNLVK